MLQSLRYSFYFFLAYFIFPLMSNAWQEHSLEKYNSTWFFKKFAGSFHYLSLSIKLLFLKSERFWPFLFDIFIFKIYSIVPTYHRYLNRAKSSLKYSIELLLFRHLFIIGHSTFIALYTKMYIIVIMVYSPYSCIIFISCQYWWLRWLVAPLLPHLAITPILV